MIKRGQVTIKDLARKLNISTSTVSRAMRDLPDVNPETKKRVRKMAEELEYEPNQVALSLVTKRTNTVGVIIPGFIIHYYSSAITGIQKTLSEAGFNIMICQSGESYETEKKNVQALLSSRVDGLICSLSRETEDLAHFKSIQKKGTPLILFNRVTNELNVSKARVDDYEGAAKAVGHLIQEGCKRIAHIAGPATLKMCNNRKEGYINTLKMHNLPVEEALIVESDFTMESGIACTRQLLSLPKPPDAIFVVCDAAAFGAMTFIKDQNLKIPEDVAVAGFTNEPLASLVHPALTTVAQPAFEIGQTAAQLFLDQINLEPEDRVPETRVLNTELIIRESSQKRKKENVNAL